MHHVFWTQLSGKSNHQGHQRAHQMTGTDLCGCVDFLYLLYPLNPNNFLKSYTLSAAFCTICCFCAGIEKPSSTVCRPVHREPTVAVLVKSKVPPYVPTDLLRKWKILPCCPALGCKITRLKHPAKDEVVIENCWCLQHWSRFRTRKMCSGND